ncbi:pyridoxal phosphate-dependent aminotransferase [Serratia marcescens]|uniref:pyridoxal phosphate-dependent aminotransferase n=1 Tax=Serratia marcescens TaxID=615 RepID=UPI0018693FEB|nr:pyridoxal phosphate-dependent aminotransferase [Serratia marcescens]
MIPESKLPALGTTIFTQMSALAQQHQAINLSQGFPDFDGPDYLKARLAWHVAQGANQYAPMTGVAALREAIADKTAELYGWQPDATAEVTVTAGATEALFAVDWQRFAAALSPRTRLVIVNTPHNPSATAWQAEDMQQLWHAIAEREIYVLSDEVYEHICFAKGGHASVLAHPQLRQRAIAVSSFGKTFHMTGWKVGYCVAPTTLSAEVRKVHQYLTFSVNTPAQLALADSLRAEPEHWRQLPAFYRAKRDRFVQALASSRLEILPCAGTYFLLADYSAISDLDDVAFCHWLTEHVGVAAIPLSVFCADPFPHKLIRLCFAKQDATLDAAAERLCRL